MSATAEEPLIAQKGPYKVELLGGYRYAWCACGMSKWQPFCDGSHTGSKVPDIKPTVWTQEKDQTAWLCGCKRSAKFPFCDGTHNRLRSDAFDQPHPPPSRRVAKQRLPLRAPGNRPALSEAGGNIRRSHVRDRGAVHAARSS